MIIDTIKEYVDKRIKVVLQNDYVYVGKLLSCGEDFLKINDKYGKTVFISANQIKVIEELRE